MVRGAMLPLPIKTPPTVAFSSSAQTLGRTSVLIIPTPGAVIVVVEEDPMTSTPDDEPLFLTFVTALLQLENFPAGTVTVPALATVTVMVTVARPPSNVVVVLTVPPF